MANVTKGTGPWVIDTASATAITSDAVAIDHILFESGTTGAADDECKFTDNTSTPIVIMDVFATGADQSIDVKMSKVPINGLVCTVLTHGKAYVYLR